MSRRLSQLLLPLPFLALVACGESDKDDDDDASDPDAEVDTDEDGGTDDEDDGATDGDTDDDTDEDTLGSRDDDGDGYSELDGDCDDTDPNVSPDGSETCNDIDDDCDGDVDEGAADGTYWYLDGDGDGHGSMWETDTYLHCNQVPGSVAISGDCNDADRNIHPGAQEITNNGVDENCDDIDIDLEACMAGFDSATLFAGAQPELESEELAWSGTLADGGVTVATWDIDEAFVYVIADGIVATATDDPLVFDLTVYATWEMGRAADPYEFQSTTRGDITGLGYQDDEFDFLCEVSTSRALEFTAIATFNAQSGADLSYGRDVRMTTLTESAISWSDISMVSISSEYGWLGDPGCTQDRSDQLAVGEGFASFADMVDSNYQDRRTHYLSASSRVGTSIGQQLEVLCPNVD
jgi:hypothetical protein